ncbi:hypothetical protein SAMN05443253_10285 [Bacillus sp. OK048]|nr:hypothetical protein SAMN05443253_10285 [Bacillus sp. OK048]
MKRTIYLRRYTNVALINQVVTRPNALIKDTHLDKVTRKTLFGQWFSPVLQLFEEQVKTIKLDYYMKKIKQSHS